MQIHPMRNYRRIFENNAQWAASVLADDPEFFAKRETGQDPHFLWIGCSDSRVPAETLAGLMPGEMFVHRNIGNQVWSTDMNMLAVVEYAVRVLDVKHIIVCGHTNCGALKTAVSASGLDGVLGHWLSDIRSTIRWHQAELDAVADEEARMDLLADLNVRQQVGILARTPTILDAWGRGARPLLHGIVYDVRSGRLHSVVEGVDGVERADRLLPHD